MKHELENRLRQQARRELREAPPTIAAGVRARLDQGEALQAPRARTLRPLVFAAGLAAAALLAWTFWPRESEVAPSRPSAPELVVGLARTGLDLATRVDQPLTAEWQNLLRDSRQLYSSVLGQLPSLPRAQ